MEEGAQKLKPEVGMGATFVSYSDLDAGTIIEVVSDVHIRVQIDKHIRTDKDGQQSTFDIGDAQYYRYEPDPEAPIYDCWLRKDGKWHDEKNMRGKVVRLGKREHYYDPSF
jgi:hypothetical protein